MLACSGGLAACYLLNARCATMRGCRGARGPLSEGGGRGGEGDAAEAAAPSLCRSRKVRCAIGLFAGTQTVSQAVVATSCPRRRAMTLGRIGAVGAAGSSRGPRSARACCALQARRRGRPRAVRLHGHRRGVRGDLRHRRAPHGRDQPVRARRARGAAPPPAARGRRGRGRRGRRRAPAARGASARSRRARRAVALIALAAFASRFVNAVINSLFPMMSSRATASPGRARRADGRRRRDELRHAAARARVRARRGVRARSRPADAVMQPEIVPAFHSARPRARSRPTGLAPARSPPPPPGVAQALLIAPAVRRLGRAGSPRSRARSRGRGRGRGARAAARARSRARRRACSRRSWRGRG